MRHTGLDRATAPSAAEAVAALTDVGGNWWAVYIGGPRSAGIGWTPDLVRGYAQAGIREFLPVYVGRQAGDRLTMDRGLADGDEAVGLLVDFGWAPPTPVCLDVEGSTYTADPNGAQAYATGWCSKVTQHGYLAGVYSNGPLLRALWTSPGSGICRFVWVARWVQNTPDTFGQLDLASTLSGYFDDRKLWQYGGRVGGMPAVAAGMEVDISVSNFALAPAPGRQGEDLMTNSQKRAFVRLAYAAFLGRHPSEADMQSWTAQISDDGFNVDQVLTQIQDSPEGLGHEKTTQYLTSHTHATTAPNRAGGA